MKKALCDKLAKRLIKLQFEAVGAHYAGEASTAGDWYHQHAWTGKQKSAFKTVFLREIKTSYKSAAAREHLWAWWDLNYGWKDFDDNPANETDD